MSERDNGFSTTCLFGENICFIMHFEVDGTRNDVFSDFATPRRRPENELSLDGSGDPQSLEGSFVAEMRNY
jgi:hypothetical protein